MKDWKTLISRLASHRKVMAHWVVSNRANFYMYLPEADRMGDSTLLYDSAIRFDEIEYIDMLSEMKLGAFTAKNDVEACRAELSAFDWVEVKEIENGIRVSVKK